MGERVMLSDGDSLIKFKSFKKVGVIGSGVMGSSIAAHLANSGVRCLMLDLPYTGDDKPESRNKIVKNGFENSLKIKPLAFFSKKNAKLIQIGNTEDDFNKLKDCDWIIEVVAENLKIKQNLFEKIEKIRSSKTIVSSNTSGLSIKDMTNGMSSAFKKHFLVTHFFNPVRYLHLLEIVCGEETLSSVKERVCCFGENILGKGIVFGKDTPNFIANRIGVFAIMKIMHLIEKGEYSIQEIDAVFSSVLGFPKSAIFRTADVVGLDVLSHVSENCFSNLKSDVWHDTFKAPNFLTEMTNKGWLGQKSKQGFYRKNNKEIEVLNIHSMKYEPTQKIKFESISNIKHIESVAERYKFLITETDKVGKLVFDVISSICIYSGSILNEIADSCEQIDNAMKWGFGWELGPFEIWDAIGIDFFNKKIDDEALVVSPWIMGKIKNKESFYDKNLNKTGEKRDIFNSIISYSSKATNIIKDTLSARLIDVGDGVLACEFKSKMNAIDDEIIENINAGLDMCEDGKFDALILYNEGKNFSVGANILLLYMAAKEKDWEQIEQIVTGFQRACRRLRYSEVPTVAAPFQMTLGGGAEISLWCNKIRSSAELYMGLVEVGVGLIPGGGGNIEMLYRNLSGVVDTPVFPSELMIRRALETVAMAKVSSSAEEARELLFLSGSDSYVMNSRQLLHYAKNDALSMVKSGFRPPDPREFRLPGKSAYATFEMALGAMKEGEFISDHDLKISLKIANIMTGGNCSPRFPVSEEYLLDLEKEAFLSLCGEIKTQERIEYMLKNNKPLRN